jgi:hypothetical protein
VPHHARDRLARDVGGVFVDVDVDEVDDGAQIIQDRREDDVRVEVDLTVCASESLVSPRPSSTNDFHQ